MPLLGHSLRFGRIHRPLQREQLIVKMLHGFFHAASVLSAKGEAPRHTDRSDRIEPVRILNDLSFDRFGDRAFILAERYAVDRLTDPLDPRLSHAALLQKTPCIRVIHGVKQLMVIGIVQQKCHHRKQFVPSTPTYGSPLTGQVPSLPLEVPVGGATVFVTNIERFEKL